MIYKSFLPNQLFYIKAHARWHNLRSWIDSRPIIESAIIILII